MNSRPLTALALLAVAVAGGCVVVHSDSKTQYSGRHVSEATLAQIQPGAEPDLVLALLGEPTSRSTLADGAEIWKWAHTRRETSSGHFILLFSGDRSVEVEGATYVEFTSEKVVRHTWRD